MPTLTTSQQSAKVQLDDAIAQRDLLQSQLADSTKALGKLKPGSDSFSLEAQRAATLQSRIDALAPDIARLADEAKSESQRRAEVEAAAAVAQAELEAQAAADLSKVEALIETINTASDAMAAAIAELASPATWATLRKTGDLNFDARNRSTQRLLWELPFVVRVAPHQGPVARLQQRYESGLRDRLPE